MVLGVALGIPIAYLLNREDDHGEYVDLVVGTIFISIGIASVLNISYILPTMVFGITVSSLCKKVEMSYEKKKMLQESLGLSSPEITQLIYEKTNKTNELKSEPHQIFHEVFRIASPVLALFFILIGLSLDLSSITQISFVGIVYIVARTVAKNFGSTAGAFVAKAEPVVRNYLGVCLLSQAGVALGLAVLISEHFATFGSGPAQIGLFILNTITATTIVFQVFGPITIKWAIDKSGEAKKSRK